MDPKPTESLTLTLDDWGVRKGSMRWVPPERAAVIRAEGDAQEARLRELRNRSRRSR